MNINEKTITNSIGMRLCRIDPGTYLMGNDAPLPDELISPSCFRHGDFDERPVHRVTISDPFYLAACQVTNRQYEQFDPTHRQVRGKLGFSQGDDEAVVFVSWEEATSFCRWLSEKEGEEYRLPTEAEWEYSCLAGTSTPFHYGASLPEECGKNQRRTWFPDPTRMTGGDYVVPLHVGETPANPWGLHDMHGNVEEWCLDWYGPYVERDQTDPTGPETGDFRVTRGGSHSTESYYLRSANRMGALPDERSWLIGFRVARGSLPVFSRRAGAPPLERHRINVRQDTKPRKLDADDAPFFTGPDRYVDIPARSYGPLFSCHNHDAAICQCPNGDMLAIWYSCVEESGRELSVVASRLRVGESRWEPSWRGSGPIGRQTAGDSGWLAARARSVPVPTSTGSHSETFPGTTSWPGTCRFPRTSVPQARGKKPVGRD